MRRNKTSSTVSLKSSRFNYEVLYALKYLYVNQPFTDNEIIKAVKNLKNNKSSGSDSILNEHIKATINIMASVYTKLFNIIFDSGLVPESWTLGDIIPIYKKQRLNY